MAKRCAVKRKREHLSPSSDPRFTEDREEGWRQTRSYTVETDHMRISGRRRPVGRGCTRKVGSGDTVSRRTWAMRCATEKREDFASNNTDEKDGGGGGGATPSRRAGCRLAYGDQWIGGDE
jgi:hypothetical protein